MAGKPVYGSGLLELSPEVSKSASGALTGALGTLGKVAAAAFVATFAAAVGAGVKGVKAFAELEKGMNEVFTLLPGISQAAMDDLTGQVRDFSKEFAVLPNEVVPALYQALSAGVPEDNVFEFLETAQKAAVGGITELETAVDGISSVVNAYGEDVLSAEEASDLMFTTVRLGKTDFGQLSSSIFNVTPIASALGVEFGDVAASLATLTGMGVPTSVATTQMRAAMSELGKEGTKADKAFRDAAGVGFQQFIEEGGNLEEALHLMADSAEASGLSVLDLFGSIEAGQAVLGLTGAGAESFAEAMIEMEDAAGATDAAYNQMDQGLSRTWERIKVTFNDAFLEIGSRLAPFVQRFSDWFADKLPTWIESGFAWFDRVGVPAIQNISQWFQKTLVPAIQKVADWFRELVDKAGGIPGLFGNLKGEAGGLTAGFALLGGPLLIIVKELFPLIKPLLDAILPPMATLANGLAPALADILGFFVDNVLPGFINMVEAVIGWITDNKGLVVAFGVAVVAFKILSAVMAINPFVLIAAAVIAVAALIITNWDSIQRFLKRVWDWIKDTVASVSKWFKDKFNEAVEFVKNIFLNFTGPGLLIKHWDKIKEGIESVVGFFRDKWDAVVDFFKGIPAKISSAAKGMWDGIKNAFKAAINWIIDRWNGIKFTLPKMDTPWGTLGGGEFRVPQIPRLHDGGVIPGRPGQEMLAILEAGERVLSRAEVAAEAAGSGFSPTFILQGTPQDLVRQVGNEVSWALGK